MSSKNLLSRFDALNAKKLHSFGEFHHECFPISFCLEASSAIATDPIFYQQFEEQLQVFFQKVKENPDLRFSTKINMITFNSAATEVRTFATVDENPALPTITVADGCHLIDGIQTSVNAIEQLLEQLEQFGVQKRQPWLIILSDANNQKQEEWQSLLQALEKMILNDELFIVPIGLTEQANISLLNKMSPAVPAMMLCKDNLSELFKWLEKIVHDSCLSVAHTSFDVGSTKGLNIAPIKSWDEI